jgi:hypothetical protein
MDFFKATNWAYFINAFKAMHNDEEYDKKFPLYAAELMKYDNIYLFLVLAVDSAVDKRESLQHIIETFTQSILNDNPLVYENLNTYIDIINYIIGYGATFPIEMLFRCKYEDDFKVSILEETSDYKIRGDLIDNLIDKPGVKEYIDFVPTTIDDITWDDIPSKSPKTIYDEDGLNPVSDINRYSVLKYYSEYLKMI